jgi:hypothetical protein
MVELICSRVIVGELAQSGKNHYGMASAASLSVKEGTMHRVPT